MRIYNINNNTQRDIKLFFSICCTTSRVQTTFLIYPLHLFRRPGRGENAIFQRGLDLFAEGFLKSLREVPSVLRLENTLVLGRLFWTTLDVPRGSLRYRGHPHYPPLQPGAIFHWVIFQNLAHTILLIIESRAQLQSR